MPPKRGKGKQQHVLCAPLKEGEQLRDLKKKTWTVGSSIGKGGFGLIYKADEGAHTSIKEDSQYVIKIEPKGNGPLFCEVAFYQRAAKPEQVEEWRKARKLRFLGVPHYIASGIHERNNESLRFLVMPRFGRDLQAIWESCGKCFKRRTVAQIALQLLDALEYCHSKEYVHADIKGANIISSFKDTNKLYLVDFGLASRYCPDGKHKAYKADPRKAHNGTIEYTSTDAHRGAEPSRRGDLEILGYCLIQWLCGNQSLPWEKKLTDPAFVFDQKTKFLSSLDTSIKKMCAGQDFPSEIHTLFKHAEDLEYEETPNYSMLKKSFEKVVSDLGGRVGGPIDFTSGKAAAGSGRGKSSSDDSSSVPVKKAKTARTSKAEKKARPLTSKTNKRSAPSSESSHSSSNDVSSPPKRKRNDKKPAKKSSAKSSKVQKIEFSDSNDDSDDCVEKPSAKTTKRTAASRRARKPAAAVVLDSSIDDESEAETVVIAKTKTKRQSKRKDTSESEQSWKGSTEDEEVDIEGVDEIPETQDVDEEFMSEDAAELEEEEEEDMFSNNPSTEEDDESYEPCNENVKPATPPPKEKLPLKELKTDNVPPPNETRRTSPRLKKQKKQIKSSRYSMMPLHTEPVLMKTDVLTGEMSGKHPVFIRSRTKNVQKADASTQVTPTLRRNRPKTKKNKAK